MRRGYKRRPMDCLLIYEIARVVGLFLENGHVRGVIERKQTVLLATIEHSANRCSLSHTRHVDETLAPFTNGKRIPNCDFSLPIENCLNAKQPAVDVECCASELQKKTYQ